MSPVLNDFGEAAYQRVTQQATALANRLGIQPEIIIQFFNDTAHFPQSLDELNRWGDTPDKEYGFRRRQPNGVWTPLMQGDTPGTGGANDPGFKHIIANEVGKIQRFQNVDPSGNVFGGSFDPAYNAAHPGQTGSGFQTAQTGLTQRTASANPFPPGTTDWSTWEQANPSNMPFGTGTPTSQSASSSPSSPFASDPGSPLPGAAGRTAIVDANAYGNTQDLQARIDQAIRDYAIARTQEERNAAYLDLQRWQTELGKVQTQQKSVTDMATAVLSAATTLGSRPQDYVKFNQATSGGRDILDQISGHGGPVAAFGGPSGQVQPGSVWDLLGRLGLQYPQTPATPAVAQPGAALPHNPDLPAVPIPGSPGVPGALQPGATGGAGGTGTQTTSGLPPSYEQALRELDQAAGGQWSGNRVDKNAVASAWWNASPSRRGTTMPAHGWG